MWWILMEEKMGGRTVKIHLIDGFPNGLISAEIMNWTGRFTVAPRSQLNRLAKRDEVKRSGIYFLKGSNPKDPSQDMIYIGESDNILNRLINHENDRDKDFWEKTIIVTSKDENLTKAHVRYLESRLIHIANQVKRALVINNTNPEPTNLPESDKDDMDYFLEQIQMILPVLGFSFVNPLPDVGVNHNVNNSIVSPIFNMIYSGATAKAQEINGEFVVLEGSLSRKAHTKSLADSYLHIRERLVNNGVLIDTDLNGFWEFSQNTPFQSPSTAANIVGGASINGREQWKVQDDGQTYAKWLEAQIKNVDQANHIENKTDEIKEFEKVRIIWKSFPTQTRQCNCGHGIEFHDQKRSSNDTLIAFLDGFEWYRDNPNQVIVYIIESDSLSDKYVIEKLKAEIREIVQKKEIVQGMINERILASPNC